MIAGVSVANKAAQSTLAAIAPDLIQLGDPAGDDWKSLKEVDIIAAGPSVAMVERFDGNGAPTVSPNLALEVGQLVDHLYPTFLDL